ncbi:MAG: TraR/DksA family transcriptional regulator [Limimaricola sp.]|uniref:TraR/DksA family transcriptional regulator n=1 Tax=Limimaricola sp. TaxID=2211665 RepID=UPI001D99F67E|nr:TraR/DksA family transcriptional regulator [Limimaricola sp.]MBI1419010.1 TraR/DksA family transcriptional regulator [Limimaricola sp.]
MTDTDRRAQLNARRAELLQRSREVEAELEEHADPDWEEQAVERETDEVLEQMGRSAATEIARIDAALARLDSGEYGYCTKCGAEIEPARLDAVPETPFCSNCAR